jgi:putative spermidine/putrescine transport system substrate-binding protein
MKWKRLAFLATGLLFLAACAQGQKTNEKQPGGPLVRPKVTLHFASFGGSFQDDLDRAVIKPICREIGCDSQVDAYSGEYDHLAATIKNGTNPFDLVHVETRFLIQGGKGGLLAPINWKEVDENKLVPGAKNRFGVGLLAWSLVLAWNQSRLPAGTPPPSSWKDFFNIKKYPGPRALRNTPEGNIELALLADGVKPQDLYKNGLDVDRALRKLSTIKPYISWWTSGAELEQKLSTSCIMAAAWNGRVFNLKKAAQVPVAFTYDGSINQFDWWVIPANSAHKNLAMKFLAAFVNGQGQDTIAKNFGYGPVALKALGAIPPDLLEQLPSDPTNAKLGVPFDGEWWAQNEAAVEKRWNQWLLGH